MFKIRISLTLILFFCFSFFSFGYETGPANSVLRVPSGGGIAKMGPVDLTSTNAVLVVPWLLGGNSGTSPSTNFIGTTDAQDLAFYTNNVETMRLTSTNGLLGVGTASPTRRLDVSGSGSGINGIRVQSTGAGTSDAAVIELRGQRQDSNIGGTYGGTTAMVKNRTDAMIQSGNILGRIGWGGNHTDGSAANILYTAWIYGVADGDFNSSTDMPTAITFITAATGTPGRLLNSTANGVERMRLGSNGNLGIGLAGTTAASRVHMQSGNAADVYSQYTAGTTTGTADTDGFKIGITSAAVAEIKNQEATAMNIINNGITAQSIDTTGAVSIRGTSTNNNASSGYVGEYIEDVNSGTAVNMPATATYGECASISLTAGDWDVTGVIFISLNGATVTSVTDIFIGTTTGNTTVGRLLGVNFDRIYINPTTDIAMNVPNYRMSLSTTTTVYLKCRASYSVATPQYNHRLSARRVR